MSIGQFFLEIVEFLYQLVPVRIVREGEQGCRIFLGKIEREPLSAGVHWFWPVLGELIVEEVNNCVFETSLQTLDTADWKTWTGSFGVRYTIQSLPLVILRLRSDDDDDTLSESVRSAAGEVVPWFKHDELDEKLAPEMLRRVRSTVHGWGYRIKKVSPINSTQAQALRLLQGGE